MALPLLSGAQSVTTTLSEQTRLAHHNPEMISCVYRAYPGPSASAYTPAPKGYKPVFISHYGRHGSRYLTEDERYLWLLDELKSHELTDIGQDILARVEVAWQQAQGRGGDLTAVGEQQHRGIAERMYRQFPSLFKGHSALHVYSSTSGRCMMSMMAFCERLKELNPKLNIQRDVCQGNMRFISYVTPAQKQLLSDSTQAAYQAYFQLRDKLEKTDAFLARIFKHPATIERPYHFMEQFYFLAQDMQDCGRPTELLSFFTTDELYSVWRIKNCQMYLANGDSPLCQGIPAQCADSLLSQVIHDADKALQDQRGGATLRFGHDTALLKLLTRMGIKECCPATGQMESLSLVWQDFNIVPMAANLQIIFYQNKEGHTLIRLLLNENEVHLDIDSPTSPYYDWETVKLKLK